MNIPHLRLATQTLIDSSLLSPKELVAKMGAIQAQDYNMSKWAIGIRLTDWNEKQIEDVMNRGGILRTHILRPTWHLVAAEDIRWMLALTAPKIKSAVRSRDRDLGLTEDVFKQSHCFIEKILGEGKHLTRQEIKDELLKKGLSTNNFQIAHLMFRAELDALVCSGVSSGKKQTYALLDERVPPYAPLSKEESIGLLTRKYFAGHAPATIDDFIWWSGLSKNDAKKGIEMNSTYLCSMQIADRLYWMPIDLTCSLPTETIHLLPAFDEYIISYKNRSDVISPEHYNKIIVSNGIFKPAIVLNGKVIGTWRNITEKKNKAVDVALFEKISDKQHETLENALSLFSSFLKFNPD